MIKQLECQMEEQIRIESRAIYEKTMMKKQSPEKSASKFKVKPKMTIQVGIDEDCPPEGTALRDSRRNKTCARTTMQGEEMTAHDEARVREVLTAKIEQLHGKMKAFFTVERRLHRESMMPQILEVRQAIEQLRMELSKPVSAQEVDVEKRQLLREKAGLLARMERINNDLRRNKNTLCDLKFQHQEVDRELKNGHGTIFKYEKQRIQTNKRLTSRVTDSGDDNENQPLISSQEGSFLGRDGSEATRITEVQNGTAASKVSGLPTISKGVTKFHKQKSPPSKRMCPEGNKRKIFQSISNGEHKVTSNTTVDGKVCCSRVADLSKQKQKWTEIFPGDFATDRSKSPPNRSVLTTVTNKNYEFDLSKEVRKYEQLVNREKWSQVNSLFNELNSPGAVDSSSQAAEADVECLQELLMDELRKKEYSSFQQKGYHQGLESKTHQIRLKLKSIFKNYSADEFFDQAMRKRQIQKELSAILQRAVR